MTAELVLTSQSQKMIKTVYTSHSLYIIYNPVHLLLVMNFSAI